MSQAWTFASTNRIPDLPLDPPESEYERYENKWELWLDKHYDPETNTIFGLNYGDNDINLVLTDRYWDQFMNEVVYGLGDE